MRTVAERWREHGFELNIADLVYFGDRNDAAAYLNAHGWETVGVSTGELFAKYGLEPLDESMPFGDVVYVDATLK
jgi:O-methyltransferase involved in polyketide biosynthesis